MSVSRCTLSRFTTAHRPGCSLGTKAVKPLSRLSRARRLTLTCNKDQKAFMDEVIARLDSTYYQPYGRTIGKMERLLAALPDREPFYEMSDYQDFPLVISEEGKCITTISQPSLQDFTLLELEPYLPAGGKALDVGSGSGYITACLSNLAGREGRVIGVEIYSSAFNYGISCLERWNKSALDNGSITMINADVFGDGPNAYDSLKSTGPYDVIHVGAAAIFPEQVIMLLDLLKPGGAMAVPQYLSDCPGPPEDNQVLVKYTKSAQGVVRGEQIREVRYMLLQGSLPKDG